MRPPSFVRPLTDAERQALEAGLRSSDAFTLRRCQIVLASARGERAPRIARSLGCDEQTVHDALTRLRRPRAGLPDPAAPRGPHDRRRRSPAGGRAAARAAAPEPAHVRTPTSLWTLDLAAEVSFEQGLTPTRVTGETIRATLAGWACEWQRAKAWITSPDPEYARKKA